MSDQAFQYQAVNFETILKAVHVMSAVSDLTDPADVLARIHALTSSEEVDRIVARSYSDCVSRSESDTDTH